MSDNSLAEWQSAATKLNIEGRAFINGRRMDALSGETRPTNNPANSKPIAEVAVCGIEDADQAVTKARAAFESGAWSNVAPADRKMVLVSWAELIQQHTEELALLESLDVGKPISDTSGIDVPSAVRTIRWSGEAIDKVYDEISPTPANCLALVRRLPLGVVAAIVPWNFPLSTTAWKLAPSLATGNSVILKPASNTPLTGIRIAELATEAGLPDGVLQVLPGPGGSLGKHLAMHMDIDGLTFTGSTPAAFAQSSATKVVAILVRLATGRLRPLSLPIRIRPEWASTTITLSGVWPAALPPKSPATTEKTKQRQIDGISGTVGNLRVNRSETTPNGRVETPCHAGRLT